MLNRTFKGSIKHSYFIDHRFLWNCFKITKVKFLIQHPSLNSALHYDVLGNLILKPFILNIVI